MNQTKCRPRVNLYDFAQLIFFTQHNALMRENWHQETICKALENVAAGETSRLIINMPPRSGKTELVSKMFVAWGMGLNPASHFILTSYSKRLATSNTYAVRDIMLSEYYQSLWNDKNLAIRDDSKAKDEFRTAGGGVVYATGTGGTITGYGAGGMDNHFAGAILVDDPAKPDEAQSDVMRQNVIDWFVQTLESRKNAPHTPIILVCQRLHENDLAGWLLGGGNGEQWDLLKIPAIDDAGESFWAQQFPIDMLRRMERANPYVFSGQYMQEPSPRDGAFFKISQLEIVDAVPANMQQVRAWDIASSAGQGDYTAGVKMGIKDGIFYILDVQRGQWSSDERDRRMKQTAQLDGIAVTQIIPQDPGAAGKSLVASMTRMLAGVPIKKVRPTGDKQTRADPFSSQVNAGNVKVLLGAWNADFIEELRQFPMGKHDDQIDASSDAFNEISGGRAFFVI